MTASPNVEARVREVVATVSRRDVIPVGCDDDLVEMLGIDSLQGLQIFAAVEKRFNIRLPDEQLMRMRTIRAITDAVSRQHEGPS